MSPSITFQPLPQTPSRPLLQRKDRTNRRSIELSASVPTTTTQILSAPAASLQDTATVSSTTTTRRRPIRNRHRSSLHLNVPAIQDRNSSLYSPVSIIHDYDWSKSCSDLPHQGGSTTTPTGISGTNHPTCCLALNQRLSLYNPRLLTAGGERYFHNDSEETVNGPEWHHAATEHKYPTDYRKGTDTDAGCINTAANNNANPIYTYPHSFTDYSTFLAGDADDSPPSRHYIKPSPRSNTKQAKWTDLKKKLRSVKTLTMSSSTITPTPSIPPRSALRGSPRRHPSTSRPELTERDSSLYVLEVGAPLALTPSLSSGSESDLADDATARIPPSMARHSVCPETGKEKDYGVFGKKRIVSERDPLRVRDGLGPKESPSGVYTPPTFPGACGPRPSHFPTHVYTPTNFQLYPTPASSAVTRSASSSSSEGDLPQTPISPTLRVFGNKTMAGLRRISGSLASFDPRSSGSGSSTPTPASSRDSYFSYSTTSSRQSSWGPVTPNSGHFPAGLGVGLMEKEGVTAPGVGGGGLPSPPIEGSLVPAPKRPVEEPKIKRKPVPEVVDLDEDCDVLADGLKRSSFAHAL